MATILFVGKGLAVVGCLAFIWVGLAFGYEGYLLEVELCATWVWCVFDPEKSVLADVFRWLQFDHLHEHFHDVLFDWIPYARNRWVHG